MPRYRLISLALLLLVFAPDFAVAQQIPPGLFDGDPFHDMTSFCRIRRRRR